MTYQYRLIWSTSRQIQPSTGTLSMRDIKSIKYHQPLHQYVGVGNACSAMLTFEYWGDVELTQRDLIQFWYKPEDGTWQRLGNFWVFECKLNRTSYSDTENKWMVTCYDRMAQTRFLYKGYRRQGLPIAFPATAQQVVNEIAYLIGTSTTSATSLYFYGADIGIEVATGKSPYISIPQPTTETMREILCYIAAAYGGNFIINRLDQLEFIPLLPADAVEPHDLVDEYGNILVFGEDTIYV